MVATLHVIPSHMAARRKFQFQDSLHHSKVSLTQDFFPSIPPNYNFKDHFDNLVQQLFKSRFPFRLTLIKMATCHLNAIVLDFRDKT